MKLWFLRLLWIAKLLKWIAGWISHRKASRPSPYRRQRQYKIGSIQHKLAFSPNFSKSSPTSQRQIIILDPKTLDKNATWWYARQCATQAIKRPRSPRWWPSISYKLLPSSSATESTFTIESDTINIVRCPTGRYKVFNDPCRRTYKKAWLRGDHLRQCRFKVIGLPSERIVVQDTSKLTRQLAHFETTLVSNVTQKLTASDQTYRLAEERLDLLAMARAQQCWLVSMAPWNLKR